MTHCQYVSVRVSSIHSLFGKYAQQKLCQKNQI